MYKRQTFYNHFLDRDDFMHSLAHESLRVITEQSADDTEGTDPAWRFAVASTRVLETGARDPLWGRAVLRLAESPTPLHAAVQQHLRTDLADGHRTGRFTHGDDTVTIDLVSGTLMASLRRLVAHDDHRQRYGSAEVIARLLEVLGINHDEAHTLAAEAEDTERTTAN